MNRTFTIENVYNGMSCFSVMGADFFDRCKLAKSVPHCNHIMNFFMYYEIMYCAIGIQSTAIELAVICIFILIVILLMISTGHLVDKYFAPSLKILSVKLHMNEYLAGVTLLSFGNTSPDLIANLMPIRRQAPLLTITFSNALAVILISGGMICYRRSFKINGACALRDLLFLLLAGELSFYLIVKTNKMTKPEASLLIILYFVNLAIIIVDLNMVRLKIKSLRREIDRMLLESPSPEQNTLLKEKNAQLRDLLQDQILIIRQPPRQSGHQLNTHRATLHGLSTKRPESQPIEIDATRTRNSLYDPLHSKNRGLIIEFVKALIPVDIEKWKNRGWLRRSFEIMISPLVLPYSIFIPVMDYSRPKHGWSKLLNCTQIITNPFVCIVLAQAMIVKEYDYWHLILDFKYAKWSLLFTVPIATMVFYLSRTDRPPTYHILFVVLTASSSMLMIAICATEVEVLCCIIGVVLRISESFSAATVRSFASAITDMIMNMEVAMQGYERMAFAAILAAPFFSITICLGTPFVLVNREQHDSKLVGEHGKNCYYFYLLTIFTTLGWTLTFNFSARRSAAIFGFLIYIIFIIYELLMETELIHEFEVDEHMDPI